MAEDWPDTPPSPRMLIAQIRAIARRDDGSVLIRGHAEERLRERGLNDRDLMRGLVIGDIEGSIRPGAFQDEWECEVVFPSSEERGSRNIAAVTIVMADDRLRIKTVMWKDRR